MTRLVPLSGSDEPDFEDSDFDFDESDEATYDRYGNYSESGMYDAGGHIIHDRWADYADALRDRIRDEQGER